MASQKVAFLYLKNISFKPDHRQTSTSSPAVRRPPALGPAAGGGGAPLPLLLLPPLVAVAVLAVAGLNLKTKHPLRPVYLTMVVEARGYSFLSQYAPKT
jgi:hypothetical protein